MSRASLVERLRGSELLLSSWSTVPDPLVAETLARDRWDACTIDLQHGMMGYAEARAMVMAITGVGKPAMARLPLDGLSMAARMLDIGVEGIIAPMINCAADVAALVDALRYPPDGNRSWGAYRAMAVGGLGREAYLAEANRRVALFAMIETREAVANLETIAATPGLAGLFVGPSDLTISMTQGRTYEPDGEPDVLEAMREVVAVAKAHGLCPGIFTPNAQQAALRIAYGFRFVTVGSDLAFMAAGSASALNTLRQSN
ncbi:HpcH/HpaI aldolase family protein [Rhodoligotrophos defluvii]|uniref:HpcH/HpaI aldolase family protein n=1 Tax=Rhodoligotrophos defluvii TaxID=2561934 RepID=UPI0010CA1A2C|nr:aldolase/citrate lyase family protein [Rhodoligotrophos defluvii]